MKVSHNHLIFFELQLQLPEEIWNLEIEMEIEMDMEMDKKLFKLK